MNIANSKEFTIPTDIMFILNEFIVLKNNKILPVKTISSNQYFNLLNRPYRLPLKNQALKLFNTYRKVSIITKNSKDIEEYRIRYIRKPSPIILSNIKEDFGLTIDGYGNIKECELDTILHEEILQRAVELAKSAYLGDINSSIELGKRSE